MLVAATLAGLLFVAAESRPDLEQGQALARAYCAGCHAVGRTGSSPRRNAPPFRDLHLRYPVESLAEALAEGIMSGHPEMPRFHFFEGEIESFVAYLKSLEVQPDARPK